MKQILIDKFVVPANALTAFSERMNYNRNFIKKLDGFVTDTAYKRTDQTGNIIIITVATWQNAVAIEKAKIAVQTEYQRAGFNMVDFITNLGIKIEREFYGELTD
ncbi:MAG: hypothetical protein ABJA76_03070 [Mucilaginibacter sp.]